MRDALRLYVHALPSGFSTDFRMPKGGISRVQLTGAACMIVHAFAIFGSIIAIAGGPQPGWPPVGWVILSATELLVSVIHLGFVSVDVLSRGAVSHGIKGVYEPDTPSGPALSVITRTIYGGRIASFAMASAFVSCLHIVFSTVYGSEWHWAVPGSQSDPVLAERSLMRFDIHMVCVLLSTTPLLTHWFDTLTHHAANGVARVAGVDGGITSNATA